MYQPKPLFDIVKFAVIAILEDQYLISRSEAASAMESHLSIMERGKLFFEIREALSDLEESGLIKVILVSHCGFEKKFYGLPNLEIKSAKDG
jgi:hypothetical protein